MTVKELAAAWTITMLGLLCLDIVDFVYARIYVMSAHLFECATQSHLCKGGLELMTNVTRDDLLAQCACFDLRKVTRAVTRLYDDCLRPLGLKITQYSLLRMIETEQQISISTLGR
jgi:hypothetical protein